MVPIWVIFVQHNPGLWWGMASKFLLVLMAAHTWAVQLLVPWIYSLLCSVECPNSPGSLFVESNINLVEILLSVVAQHSEELCALLTQLFVWSEDLKANSSDTFFDKQACIVVAFLPIWKELRYLWIVAVPWENCWIEIIVVSLNSSFLVYN